MLRYPLTLAGLVLLCGCGDESSGSESEPVPTESASCPNAGPHLVEVVRELTGDNGTFVDGCDEDGNLIDYTCARGSNEVCNGYECYDEEPATETVVPRIKDCVGTCSAGKCESMCPSTGDMLRYDGQVGDDYIIVNDTTSESFTCTTLTCDPPPAVGTTWELEYYEAGSQTCMGDSTFAASAPSADVACLFSCSFKG